MRNRREIENRVDRLETTARLGELEYRFSGGSYARLRRCDQIGALHDVVDGVKSWRANVLVNATSCSDNSHLHQLAAALMAGPAEPPTKDVKETVQ